MSLYNFVNNWLVSFGIFLTSFHPARYDIVKRRCYFGAYSSVGVIGFYTITVFVMLSVKMCQLCLRTWICDGIQLV